MPKVLSSKKTRSTTDSTGPKTHRKQAVYPPPALESKFTFLYDQLDTMGQTLRELTSSCPLVKEVPKLEKLADNLEKKRLEVGGYVELIHNRVKSARPPLRGIGSKLDNPPPASLNHDHDHNNHSPLPPALESRFTLLYNQLHDMGRTLFALRSMINEVPDLRRLGNISEKKRAEARQYVGLMHDRIRMPFTIVENVSAQTYPQAAVQGRADPGAPLFLKGIVPQQGPPSSPLQKGVPYLLEVQHEPQGDYATVPFPFTVKFTPDDPSWTDPETGRNMSVPGVVIGTDVDSRDGLGRVWGAYREPVWNCTGEEGDRVEKIKGKLSWKEVRIPMSHENHTRGVGVDLGHVRLMPRTNVCDEKAKAVVQYTDASGGAASSNASTLPAAPVTPFSPVSSQPQEPDIQTGSSRKSRDTSVDAENGMNAEADEVKLPVRQESNSRKPSTRSDTARKNKRKRGAVEEEEKQQQRDEGSVKTSTKRRASKRVRVKA